MKKDIHPKDYRPVVFQDSNNGTTYLTRSTVAAEEIITIEGTEYPLVKVHISSSSHPFFTGEERIVDIEGRVDKFKARREAAEKAKEALKAKARKSNKKQATSNRQEPQKLGAKPAPRQDNKDDRPKADAKPEQPKAGETNPQQPKADE
jgi:large subunit ribosomal protein L31